MLGSFLSARRRWSSWPVSSALNGINSGSVTADAHLLQLPPSSCETFLALAIIKVRIESPAKSLLYFFTTFIQTTASNPTIYSNRVQPWPSVAFKPDLDMFSTAVFVRLRVRTHLAHLNMQWNTLSKASMNPRRSLSPTRPWLLKPLYDRKPAAWTRARHNASFSQENTFVSGTHPSSQTLLGPPFQPNGNSRRKVGRMREGDIATPPYLCRERIWSSTTIRPDASMPFPSLREQHEGGLGASSSSSSNKLDLSLSFRMRSRSLSRTRASLSTSGENNGAQSPGVVTQTAPRPASSLWWKHPFKVTPQLNLNRGNSSPLPRRRSLPPPLGFHPLKHVGVLKCIPFRDHSIPNLSSKLVRREKMTSPGGLSLCQLFPPHTHRRAELRRLHDVTVPPQVADLITRLSNTADDALVFCNSHGVEALVDQIEYEVDLDIREHGDQQKSRQIFGSHGELPVVRAAVLKHILRSMHRMMQSSGTSEGLRGLIDMSILGSIKKIIYRGLFGPSVLPIAINIMATFVHNEPEAGLPETFYKSIELGLEPAIEVSKLTSRQEVILTPQQVIQAIPNAIGVLCLNEVGQSQLAAHPSIIPPFSSYSPLIATSRYCWRRRTQSSVQHRRTYPAPSFLEASSLRGLKSTMTKIEELGHAYVPPDEIRHFYNLTVVPPPSTISEVSEEAGDKMEGVETSQSSLIETTANPLTLAALLDPRSEEAMRLHENNIISFIDILGRFLEGFFQHTLHCRDFITQTDGVVCLGRLTALPCLPFDFATSVGRLDGSNNATLTEVAPTETLQQLSFLVKESLQATHDFWATGKQESNLLPLLNVTGFAHGRGAIALLQTLMNSTTPQVIADLGSLHRASIWENIVFKAALAVQGIEVTDMGFPRAAAEHALRRTHNNKFTIQLPGRVILPLREHHGPVPFPTPHRSFTEAAAGWSVVLRCSCQVRSSSNSGDGMDTSSPDAAITTKTQVGIATVASASQQSLFADMPGLQGLPPNNSELGRFERGEIGYVYSSSLSDWCMLHSTQAQELTLCASVVPTVSVTPSSRPSTVSRSSTDTTPKQLPVQPIPTKSTLEAGAPVLDVIRNQVLTTSSSSQTIVPNSSTLPRIDPSTIISTSATSGPDIAGAHPIPSSLLTTLALPTLLSLTKYHNALDAESDYADLRNVMKPALSKGSDVEMMRVLGLGLKGTKGPFDVIVGGDGDGNVGQGSGAQPFRSFHSISLRVYWWEGPLEDFILPEMKPEECTKSTDVWFDSGTSWSMLDALPSTGRSHRADVCMEGSDQHRGWFQIGSRSVVESDAVAKGLRPYGTLITHGMVLAEKGKKMSKSLGNIVGPSTIVLGGSDKKKDPAYGADLLRFWAASIEYKNDMSIGRTSLSQTAEAMHKIRNSARFVLGNIMDGDVLRDFERVERNNMGFMKRKTESAALHQAVDTLNKAKKSKTNGSTAASGSRSIGIAANPKNSTTDTKKRSLAPPQDEILTEYLATLIKAAHNKVPVLESDEEDDNAMDLGLNKDEASYLDDLKKEWCNVPLPALKPPKLPNNGLKNKEDIEDDEEQDEALRHGDDMDLAPLENNEDEAEVLSVDDDHIVVEDVTKIRRKPTTQKRGRREKVVIKDFQNEELALLAKRCARMATCTINMFPDNKLFAWDLFSRTLKSMAAEGNAIEMVKYLHKITLGKDSHKRQDLVTFMNYGPTSIRFDIGTHVRLRVTQHFGLPGNMSQEQIISVVTWLMAKRRYHEGNVNHECNVDWFPTQERTTDGLPFHSSLIGSILRGYFFEGTPQQDQVLVAYLKKERMVPLPLIAMITTLIGNAIQEYAIGYKQPNVLSAKKSRFPSPAFFNRVQKRIWKEMNTAAPEIVPAQVYDYDTLNALALATESEDEEMDDMPTINNLEEEDPLFKEKESESADVSRDNMENEEDEVKEESRLAEKEGEFRGFRAADLVQVRKFDDDDDDDDDNVLIEAAE
ncbi:hypothetical protein D9757_015000 [Collybiopsis confluens]|uniref:Uncharacterized protein n=1 Tax=Collybiopsis confluens TaxID=2823264 RepID=A0A8H5CK52_9AGAR|nr:hypothetical protein D9757_015000 [Collybiopsis confluens]